MVNIAKAGTDRPRTTQGAISTRIHKSGAFGDELRSFAIGDMTIESMTGRDGARIVVEWAGKRHSLRNIMAFIEGLAPSAAILRDEPDLAALEQTAARVRGVVAAPEFRGYEAEVAEAVVARFNSGNG